MLLRRAVSELSLLSRPSLRLISPEPIAHVTAFSAKSVVAAFIRLRDIVPLLFQLADARRKFRDAQMVDCLHWSYRAETLHVRDDLPLLVVHGMPLH